MTDASPCRARSLDGRTLTLAVEGDAAGPPLLPGDLVVVDAGDASYLAQVATPPAAPAPSDPGHAGSGHVIGRLGDDLVPDRADRRPFTDAAVSAAGPEHLDALLDAGQAHLPVGAWTTGGSATVAARVRAGGFNRHTFLCGQSGSGKTYALGVLLEQLLLHTDLRTVVLDPNADFVRLAEARDGVADDQVAPLRRHGVRALGAASTGRDPLLLRFVTMPRRAQAAVLQMDPILDREEYHHFVQQMHHLRSSEVGGLVAELAEGGPAGVALAQRLVNLGLPDWEVWAQDRRSAAEIVDQEGGTTVLDLSGFRDPREPLAVSLDLVEHLWADRESRRPTLLVIDEAHNLCPPEPEGTLQKALVDRLVQIAAEGRKYGLWLLLSTQRPSKIHPQVLSQCDNLVLMRMNSPADLTELGRVFGFAPPAMVAASPGFVQGEALLAGGFVAVPSLIRMGARLTREGGLDVPVPVTPS